MLDTTQPDGQAVPNARAFAKVRGAFAAKKLDAVIADAVLMAMDDPDDAAKLAPAIADLSGAFAVAKLSAEDTAKIVTEALADATDVAGLKEAVLNKVNAIWVAQGGDDVPRFGPRTYGVGGSYDQGEGLRAKMVAGLTAKLSGKAETPMAREAAQMSIPEMVMTCARNAGLRPANIAEAVRMRGLWTTSDFPRILDASLGNEVGREIDTAEIPIQRAARVVTRPDYRPSKMLQASRTTMPQEVPEGAEIKTVTLTESGENSVQLRDFAGIYGMTMQAFVNDGSALGLLQDMGRRMAAGAMERKRAILLEPLLANTGLGDTMADGKAYFHVDHGNLAAVPSALSVASIGAGVTAMARLKGPFGEPLAVRPRFLVVPPELQFVAAQVLASVAAATTNDVNPLSGSLEIIVEPGLTNVTAWYLVADPGVYDGLVLGYLDGQTQPRVESKEGWDVLSVEWRLWWPMDSALTGTASWFRNAGA